LAGNADARQRGIAVLERADLDRWIEPNRHLLLVDGAPPKRCAHRFDYVPAGYAGCASDAAGNWFGHVVTPEMKMPAEAGMKEATRG